MAALSQEALQQDTDSMVGFGPESRREILEKERFSSQLVNNTLTDKYSISVSSWIYLAFWILNPSGLTQAHFKPFFN